MENAKKFFEESIRTEEAKKLLGSCKKPVTEEETIELYAEIAGKLGIELSEEEIKAYFSEIKVSAEVDDEELSQLSGGAGDHPECDDTFRNEENCWWEDGCDLIINKYGGYLCFANYYNYRNGKYVQVCTQSRYA